MASIAPSRKGSFDLVVVGGGVIGLSVAWAATRQGLTVRVIDTPFPGAASRVAAGLLAASLGAPPQGAQATFRRAASGYAGFLAEISRATGMPLSVGQGILEVAQTPGSDPSLNSAGDPHVQILTAREVAARAPDLAAVSGGALHPLDGWIEPAALVDALTAALAPATRIAGRAMRIKTTPSEIGVLLEDGETVRGRHVVIASGSWSPSIDRLPTSLPIVPAKGETLVLESKHSLSVAIACDDFYLVPRAGALVVGATLEFVGFDAGTTEAGRSLLESFARRLIPEVFAHSTARTMWAGLRPMTPDKLPIVDRDPSDGRIIYACGHGKNGLLLAGVTAEIVLQLLAGNRQDGDSPFRLDRFARR